MSARAMTSFLVTLRFWRTARETLASRRFFLCSEALDILPHSRICVDLLHTFHLGVVLEFVKSCFWHVIESGVWGQLGANQEEGLQRVVLALR